VDGLVAVDDHKAKYGFNEICKINWQLNMQTTVVNK